MRDGLTGLGLVLAALLACGGKREDSISPATSAAASSAPTAAPPPPSNPRGEEQSMIASSAAVFQGDKLSACVEAVFTRAPLAEFLEKLAAQDAGAKSLTVEAVAAEEVTVYVEGGKTLLGEALDKRIGAGTAQALRPRGKATALPRDCGSQFAGRTAIASCLVVARSKADAGTPMQIALGITHYDALLGDAPMRGCLAAKGEWKELAHDSLEHMQARHRQLYDKLQKDIGD